VVIHKSTNTWDILTEHMGGAERFSHLDSTETAENTMVVDEIKKQQLVSPFVRVLGQNPQSRTKQSGGQVRQRGNS